MTHKAGSRQAQTPTHKTNTRSGQYRPVPQLGEEGEAKQTAKGEEQLKQKQGGRRRTEREKRGGKGKRG